MQSPEYGPIDPNSETARAIRLIDGKLPAWRTAPAETPIKDDSDMAESMMELRSKWSERPDSDH